MNKRLADREYLAGEYSIADIASYPWILPQRQGQDMADFPHLERWRAAIAARPATARAYARAKEINTAATVDDPKARAILFGQGKEVVR